MTAFNVEPLHREFGARITGIDLTEPLGNDDVISIHAAIDRYSVLVFPYQNMTDDRHLAFTKLLGEPEPEHVTFGKTGRIEYFGSVGNVQDDGGKQDNHHAGTRYQKGNNLWHSDSSFRERPSYVSILHAYEVPGEGGQTEFASQRSAYARLSDEMKTRIDPLRVVHDYVFSRSPVAPVDPNHAASLPPVCHSLVRTNPATGDKNFYVGSHARSVPGLSGFESRKLLDSLLEEAVGREHVYGHQWSVGDTVIWDNRCILHRGTGYDADKWRRRLRQTRVWGGGKGEIPAP